jgi:hypothetical protein
MKFQLRQYEVDDLRVVQVEVLDSDEKVIRATSLHFLKKVVNKEYLLSLSMEDLLLKEMVFWVKSEYPELLL